MQQLEKHFQQETDQSKSTTNRSASPEKLQQLRWQHERFTAGGGQPADHQSRTSIQDEATSDTTRRSKEKRPALAKIQTGRAIAENGDFVPRTVNLASESTKDNPKLLGGAGELGAWNTLKNSLTTIKNEFYTASEQDTKNEISASCEISINNKLKVFRGLLDKYRPRLDYSTLTNIENSIPESAKEPVFLSSIESCLTFVENNINDIQSR